MKNDRDDLASRHIVWQSNVLQIVLNIYFGYIRVLPSWKRSFPRYIPSAIQEIEELAPNKIKIKIATQAGEYVFVFEERSTLVLEVAEFVQTGVLKLFYNNEPVLHLNISPSDPDEIGKTWVARGVEQFKDGEWVSELTKLYAEFVDWETKQKNEDELLQQDELKGVAELKQKISNLPRASEETRSWLWRMLRRKSA
jgi:hypothetical protein